MRDIVSKNLLSWLSFCTTVFPINANVSMVDCHQAKVQKTDEEDGFDDTIIHKALFYNKRVTEYKVGSNSFSASAPL